MPIGPTAARCRINPTDAGQSRRFAQLDILTRDAPESARHAHAAAPWRASGGLLQLAVGAAIQWQRAQGGLGRLARRRAVVAAVAPVAAAVQAGFLQLLAEHVDRLALHVVEAVVLHREVLDHAVAGVAARAAVAQGLV